MNHFIFDETFGLKKDLNCLLGFSELPYFLSDEVQIKYALFENLRDKIIQIYSEEERHEIRDMLYLLPKRIESILNSVIDGGVDDFKVLVRDAYVEILKNQHSFASRSLPLGSQGKEAWMEKREFELDMHERITFDRFSDPKREPRVFKWLDISRLSEM